MARVLANVLLAPDALNVRQLADRTRLAYSVVQREIDRLEKAGIVRSERFAQARVVHPDERHRLYPELRAMLLKTYGPEAVMGDLLGKIPGIEEAFLFGSWAARYAGDWGAAPADLDVLVVGRPDPPAVEEAAAEAEDQLGFPVQTVIVESDTWKSKRSGFVRTVAERPLLPIELREP